MSWEQAWKEGRNRWDAGSPAPALEELLESTQLSPRHSASGSLPPRALVPGCGSGYDVFALARAGYSTLGLDISPTALQRFESLREALPEQVRNRTSSRVGDFFQDEDLGRFDLIWDYTFLCAIEPERRQEWARRAASLVVPGGMLVSLVFPVLPAPDYVSARENGPPYPLRPELVIELLYDHFDLDGLSQPAESHPGREGKEWIAHFIRREA